MLCVFNVRTYTYTQPQPILQSSRTTLEEERERLVSTQSSPPSCAVIKVSMLYGAHRYTQLEDALTSHRKHCERWGCGYEELQHDLTGRKLYSKHYFLLSIMLQELAKPEEERQRWLM
jgi:hypothetical protein